MIEKIDSSRTKVKNFGLLFGVICTLVVGYLLYRGSGLWPWFAAGAGFFFLTGLAAYPVLKPVYIGWMMFAFVLGWINTRIILGVFFYLILTPIGLFLRLTGKDLLDKRLDRTAKTYWIKRERVPFDKARYEQQF